MYRLTERRKAKAAPILEKYGAQLHQTGEIEVRRFEDALRDCWGIGYRELKDIIVEMSRMDEFKYLSAYYMENSNSGVGVVMEFQPALAKLYGIQHYHHKDLENRRKEFWKGLAKHKYLEKH